MRTINHTVLITGGTRGIGLALAKRFWEAGNRVIITGRNPDTLANAQAELPGAEAILADMTNPLNLKNLHTSYPDVSVLINNAAVQYNYALTESEAAWERVTTEIHTNFVGLVQLTALYLPGLQAQPESAIVNFSSGLGFVPKQSAPVYCATKSAVHTFSLSLRWQLEQTGIKVFEVIPALVDTDMTVGRGENKITTKQLVDEFWANFEKDRHQIAIGRTRMLLMLDRVFPSIAQRIMRHS
ncbi:MAG: SDR family NAD(P)-dependent oxidoreductase [Anaerolineae bacterium]|nr:SDR family NAD(P)-dependent oxidoreductase [Anaerolineae bacterium]